MEEAFTTSIGENVKYHKEQTEVSNFKLNSLKKDSSNLLYLTLEIKKIGLVKIQGKATTVRYEVKVMDGKNAEFSEVS